MFAVFAKGSRQAVPLSPLSPKGSSGCPPQPAKRLAYCFVALSVDTN